ncbi:lutropin subunit beta [Striga asiatica]|uniref:Lutropin subunit beta n=1 Tax=Striga asiatica TaxID=4170 RepID=A0A5A7Q6Z8_STRAF|nr:lutropin subunit beta [Striga asiatica]
MAFRTLSRIHYDYLSAQPKHIAIDIIEDIASDALMEGIDQKRDFLFDKAGVPLPQDVYSITDLVFNRLTLHNCPNGSLAEIRSFSYKPKIIEFEVSRTDSGKTKLGPSPYPLTVHSPQISENPN